MIQTIMTRPRMAQALAEIPSPVPPPEPTFTGLSGAIESVGILAILSASVWAGLRVGIQSSNAPVKAVGYIGGIGSAALALLYLGTKLGIAQDAGLPAVRVTPT